MREDESFASEPDVASAGTGPGDFGPIAERQPVPPFKCAPPYHRPDCYGTNCDDEATRERCDPF